MKSEPKAGDVMSHREVVKALSQTLQIPDKTVASILTGLASLAATELKNGKRLQISNLGRLAIREKAGDATTVDAVTKRVVLIPSKQFKSDLGI